MTTPFGTRKRQGFRVSFVLVPVCVALLVLAGIYLAPALLESAPTDYDNETMRYNLQKSAANLQYARAQQNGNFDLAIQAYIDALSIRPENAEAHSDLGAVYYEKGNALMAPPVEEDLTEYAVEYDHDAKETVDYITAQLAKIESGKFVWTVRKDVYQRISRYVDELNGDGTKLLFAGAPVSMKSGVAIYEITLINGATARAFKSAEGRYWRAIDIKPDYAPAYRNLGVVYIQMRRFDEAKRIFKQALLLEPQDRELARYVQQLAAY